MSHIVLRRLFLSIVLFLEFAAVTFVSLAYDIRSDDTKCHINNTRNIANLIVFIYICFVTFSIYILHRTNDTISELHFIDHQPSNEEQILIDVEATDRTYIGAWMIHTVIIIVFLSVIIFSLFKCGKGYFAV